MQEACKKAAADAFGNLIFGIDDNLAMLSGTIAISIPFSPSVSRR